MADLEIFLETLTPICFTYLYYLLYFKNFIIYIYYIFKFLPEIFIKYPRSKT